MFQVRHHQHGDACLYHAADNTLIYIAEGHFDIMVDYAPAASLDKGECLFVRKGHVVSLVNSDEPSAATPVSVILSLPRQILFDYFKTLHHDDLPTLVEPSKSIHRVLHRSSLLTSLFDSFKPYWQRAQTPEHHWLRIKVLEAIRMLLLVDAALYESLFDFNGEWRLDIMDFLEHNYRYDLTVDDMAAYTGRSLATFKRDFARLTYLSPRNWLIERRLREARRLFPTTDWSVYEVMQRVGFKNFSHFSRRYRQRFGETPTATRTAR